MVCVPTERLVVENDVPVPICPLMLDVHTSDAPESAPSSTSLPLPENVTAVPCTTLAPLAGAVIVAVGAVLGAVIVIERVAVPVAPFESFAVSVIVCVPTESALVEKPVPVPIWPFRLLVQ